MVPRYTGTNELWLGIEAEGELEGVLTLFVKGAVSRGQITKTLKQSRCADCHHLYFGAGYRSPIDYATVGHFLAAKGSPTFVSAEASRLPDDLNLLANGLRFVWAIENTDDLRRGLKLVKASRISTGNVVLKLEDKMVVLTFHVGNLQSNLTNAPAYDGDKMIWREK